MSGTSETGFERDLLPIGRNAVPHYPATFYSRRGRKLAFGKTAVTFGGRNAKDDVPISVYKDYRKF